MTNSGRREFLKNSMALALTPAAGGALLAANPSEESSAAQQARGGFLQRLFRLRRLKPQARLFIPCTVGTGTGRRCFCCTGFRKRMCCGARWRRRWRRIIFW